MRELVIRRRADQDSNLERLRSGARRPVIYPEDDARNILAASAAKFEVLADNADNPHERGFWSRAQEQTARYAATLAYVRMLEGGIPESWDHVHYTRPEADQAQAVITWHGELIRSYAIQGSLGKNHPAGQGNHHDAAGQEGKGREGRRNHRHPKHPLTVRQGRAENQRRAAGAGDPGAGEAPPFDTNCPPGALPDIDPPCLTIRAAFATFAGFRGANGQ